MPPAYDRSMVQPQRNAGDTDATASNRIDGKLRDADGRQQSQNVNATDKQTDLYDAIVPKFKIDPELCGDRHAIKRSGRRH